MVAVAVHGAAVRTNVNLIGKNLEITTVTGRYRSGRFDIKPAFLIGGRLIGASLLERHWASYSLPSQVLPMMLIKALILLV